MARGRRNDPKSNNILHKGLNKLEQCFIAGKGRSKHHDKKSKHGIAPYIYTDSTLRQYKKDWGRFCAYLEAQGFKVKTFADAVQYVQMYIDWLMQQPGCWGQLLSAWTVRKRFAAVAKVLCLTASDYNLPTRRRAHIRRSRRHRTNKANTAPKNQDFIRFCTATGLRKGKELSRLRGTDLVSNANGTYSIHVRQGKGGRERYALIIGSPEDIALVVELMRAAGDNLVWPHIPSGVDVHGCRADYALALYLARARSIADAPRKERYYCRNDRRGITLDRKALIFVSHQLGHNRPGVVASNYLYDYHGE